MAWYFYLFASFISVAKRSATSLRANRLSFGWGSRRRSRSCRRRFDHQQLPGHLAPATSLRGSMGRDGAKIENRTKRSRRLFHSGSDDGLSLIRYGSISPTFYEQLLCKKIPKAQKDCLKQLFCALGSAGVKAAHRMLLKLTIWRMSGVNFINMLTLRF